VKTPTTSPPEQHTIPCSSKHKTVDYQSESCRNIIAHNRIGSRFSHGLGHQVTEGEQMPRSASHQSRCLSMWSRMSQEGHEDQFQPPRLNGRCRFSEATFAGTHGNGQDAPIADLPALALERGGFDRGRVKWTKVERRIRLRYSHSNGIARFR
jgi:hypothetical protein